MNYKSEAAIKFVQLIWEPRVGDKVHYWPSYFCGVKRGAVSKVLTAAELEINEEDQVYRTRAVRYRPTIKDYEKVLTELSGAFTYIESTSASGHKIAAVSVNGRNVILRGRARKILIGLLELRGIDYKINELVNTTLQKFRGEISNVIRFTKSNTAP